MRSTLMAILLLTSCVESYKKPMSTPHVDPPPPPPPVPEALPAPAPAPPVQVLPPLPVQEKLIDRAPAATPSPKPAPRPKAQPKKALPPAVPGFDQLKYEEHPKLFVGVPQTFQINIGDPATIAAEGTPQTIAHVMNIQRSTYYLIGLEADTPGRFLVEPSPGQEQKQHRARAGSSAHWTYRVTPLKRGATKLVYTLRIYGEGDDAGTVVQVKPIEVVVGWSWPSSPWFLIVKWCKEWGVGAAVVGVLVGALAAWLKPREQRQTT